jgi:predicted esterase
VLGFSQGALHAMLIAAEHPNTYAGVVALSPGGSLARRLADPPLNRDERAARCAFIHGEQEPHAPYVEIWDIACSKAGWKFYTATHPGGHQFPDNWPELQPEIATFLTP